MTELQTISRLSIFLREHGEEELFELLDKYGVEYTAKKVLGYSSGVALRNQMKRMGLWQKFKQ